MVCNFEVMAPPRKKPRTKALGDDPSIALANGSCPFMECADLPMELIFRLIPGLSGDEIQAKMRLQLVNRKFKTMVTKSSIWKDTNVLTLGGDNYHFGKFPINNIQFDRMDSQNALSNLLKVISVKTINFGRMLHDRLLMLDISDEIDSHPESFIPLERLVFSLNGALNSTTDRCIQMLVPSLSRLPLEQLKQITVSGNSYGDNFFRSFWAILRLCTNLEVLEIQTGERYEIQLLEMYHIIGTGHCPNLQTLVIDVKNVIAHAESLANVINSLDNVTSITLSVQLGTNPEHFISLLTGKVLCMYWIFVENIS